MMQHTTAVSGVVGVLLVLFSHLAGVYGASVVYYETILASLDNEVTQTALLILSHKEAEKMLSKHEKQHFVSVSE